MKYDPTNSTERRICLHAVQCVKTQPNGMTEIYLEHLREETWADLLADKVVYSRQAGHGAAQRPVRGRPGPVRSVNPV